MRIKMHRSLTNYTGRHSYTSIKNFHNDGFPEPIDLCVRETRKWFDIPLPRGTKWTLVLSRKQIIDDSYKCKMLDSHNMVILNPETGKEVRRGLYYSMGTYLNNKYGRKYFYLGVEL